MRKMGGLKILLAALVIISLTGAAQAGDWLMRGHDTLHSGTSDEVVEPPLGLLWKYKTGSSIQSSPAITGGIVYVGSNDYNVYALDASTGALKWKYTTGNMITSSPAVSNGIVYAGSYDTNVYALDASTGALKWKYKTGGSVLSSPAVSGGVVYVGANDYNVYALDASTGSLKWKYTTMGMVVSSPAVSGNMVYAGSKDNNLYALDASTGSLRWKFTTGHDVDSSPAVYGNAVYVGSWDGYVYALDASTGALKWKYTTGSGVSSPAVSAGVVYAGSYDNNLYALDAATGSLKWKYTTAGSVASPAISGGVIYIGSGSGDNTLYALDASTGSLKWKYTTGGPVFLPAISGGTVYVGSWDYNLYAFAPASTPTSTVPVYTYIPPTATVTTTPIPTAIYVVPTSTPLTIPVSPTSTVTTSKILVKLDNRRGFIPNTLTIKLGDEIVWGNGEAETVTIVSSDGLFAAQPLEYDKRYSYMFNKQGTFIFYLSENSNLKGIIVVESPATYTPTPASTMNPQSRQIHNIHIGPGTAGLNCDACHGFPPVVPPPSGICNNCHPSGVPTSATPAATYITPTSDTSPPSISISKQIVDSNKNGQLDEGEKLVINYGAIDDSGIKSLKVLLDGNLIEIRNKEGIYSVTTDSLSMGEHSIVVEAIDSKENKKSEEMKISVERTGPSVYFQKTRYEVNEGDDVNVVLSTVNPIGNPKMAALLILKPPGNGVSTYESDCKGYSGQCTGKFEIEPGDSVRSISVRMKAEKAGEYPIDAEVYYQFEGGQRSPTRYETLTLVVKPRSNPKTIPTSAQTPMQKSVPGFGIVIGASGLLLAIFLKRR